MLVVAHRIFIAVCGIFSCSMWDLSVVACELLVATCGIQLPDQGSNLGPLHWERRVLATGPPGKSLEHFFENYVFIYLWLHWVFTAVRGLSLVAASRGYSLLQCTGFSLWWLLLLQSMGSRCMGFSSCGTQAQQLWLTGSRAQAQQLWHTGLVAPRHVGSSWTRARTRVPCIGRRIPNHCVTREVPRALLNNLSVPLLSHLQNEITAATFWFFWRLNE